jgi:hypothetical protein
MSGPQDAPEAEDPCTQTDCGSNQRRDQRNFQSFHGAASIVGYDKNHNFVPLFLPFQFSPPCFLRKTDSPTTFHRHLPPNSLLPSHGIEHPQYVIQFDVVNIEQTDV